MNLTTTGTISNYYENSIVCQDRLGTIVREKNVLIGARLETRTRECVVPLAGWEPDGSIPVVLAIDRLVTVVAGSVVPLRSSIFAPFIYKSDDFTKTGSGQT